MPKLVVDADEFYSIEEAAAILLMGRATVYRMIKDGRMSSIRVGDRRLIPKGEIERLQKSLK